jgi:hypothetical protein
MQIYVPDTLNALYMLTHTLGTLLSHIPSSCRAMLSLSCQYTSKMKSGERKETRLESHWHRCAEPAQETEVFLPLSSSSLSLQSTVPRTNRALQRLPFLPRCASPSPSIHFLTFMPHLSWWLALGVTILAAGNSAPSSLLSSSSALSSARYPKYR